MFLDIIPVLIWLTIGFKIWKHTFFMCHTRQFYKNTCRPKSPLTKSGRPFLKFLAYSVVFELVLIMKAIVEVVICLIRRILCISRRDKRSEFFPSFLKFFSNFIAVATSNSILCWFAYIQFLLLAIQYFEFFQNHGTTIL